MNSATTWTDRPTGMQALSERKKFMFDQTAAPNALIHCHSVDRHEVHLWEPHLKYPGWNYTSDSPERPWSCPGTPDGTEDYRFGFRAGLDGSRRWGNPRDPGWIRAQSSEFRAWWVLQDSDYQAGFLDGAEIRMTLFS